MPYFFDRSREYSWDFSAGQNIDYHEEATKLLYAVSVQEEADQTNALGGLAGDMTSFAYEDIASNIICLAD